MDNSKRTWSDGGPKFSVKVRVFYDKATDIVTLQYDDEDGPIFKQSASYKEMSEFVDGLVDILKQVEKMKDVDNSMDTYQ